MKLYTLISLALGIFGGTYAALAALRAYFDGWIKERRDTAEIHVRKISEHYGKDKKSTKGCESNQWWIGFSRKCWLWANAIPIFIFSIFVFFVAIWVLVDWAAICNQKDGDSIDYSHPPWTWFYFGLLYLVIISGICLISAVAALVVCHCISRVLRGKHEMVLDEENKKIAPPSPPSPPSPPVVTG